MFLLCERRDRDSGYANAPPFPLGPLGPRSNAPTRLRRVPGSNLFSIKLSCNKTHLAVCFIA